MDNHCYTGDGESLDSRANNSKNNTHKEGNVALSPVTRVGKGPSRFVLNLKIPKRSIFLYSCALSADNSFLLQKAFDRIMNTTLDNLSLPPHCFQNNYIYKGIFPHLHFPHIGFEKKWKILFTTMYLALFFSFWNNYSGLYQNKVLPMLNHRAAENISPLTSQTRQLSLREETQLAQGKPASE